MRDDLAGRRVDAVDVPRLRDDPQRAERGVDLAGNVVELRPAGDLVRCRVDADQLGVLRVRDPDRAVGARDPARLAAYVDPGDDAAARCSGEGGGRERRENWG